MMTKDSKINLNVREDLPIKYYLNLHMLEDHFNEDSVLYEIIAYTVQKINENKDKVLSYNNLKFSSKTLKYIFGNEKLEEGKDDIIKHLKTLIKGGSLEAKGKTFFVTEKGVIKFYNVEITK